ncbi:MAG: ankyrin repeat domain-containing protein [Minicystis sp.]
MSDELFSAIDALDVPRVRALLAGGADPNALQDTWAGLRPLHAAIQTIAVSDGGGGLDLITVLLEHGADVNGWTASKDQTPLLTALFEQMPAAAELLLAAGADPNVRSSEGESPLRVAAAAGDRAMVSRLLAAGAAKTIDDWGGLSGRTALALAAERLDVPMMKMLLDAGADPRAQGEYGLTADQRLPPREQSDPEVWAAAFEMLRTAPSRRHRQ